MNSKKIENTDRKLIDELPQYKSKLPRQRKGNGEIPDKKDRPLSFVQIMAPILIAVVGVVVIYFMPDKLTSGPPSDDAQVNAAQAPSPKTEASLAISAAPRDESMVSPKPKAALAPASLQKAPQGKAAIARPDKAGAKVAHFSKNPAVAEAKAPVEGEKQISLVSALVCDNVNDRQPSVEKNAFSTGDGRRVYVWMEIRSKSQPFVIQHNYYLNGKAHSQVPLNIKYPRMRTWSYITIDRAEHIGDWRVDIMRNDTVLKSIEFQVGASDQS